MNRILIIFSFTLGLPLAASASESYQFKNAVGLWKAYDAKNQSIDLLVTANGNGLVMTFCTPSIETTGTCNKLFTFVATGTYVSNRDGIAFEHRERDYYVIDYFSVDAANPDRITRAFGADGISYFRFK